MLPVNNTLPNVAGTPLCTVSTPDNCQPPTNASARRPMLLSNGLPFPKGSSHIAVIVNICVWSIPAIALVGVGSPAFKYAPLLSWKRSNRRGV